MSSLGAAKRYGTRLLLSPRNRALLHPGINFSVGYAPQYFIQSRGHPVRSSILHGYVGPTQARRAVTRCRNALLGRTAVPAAPLIYAYWLMIAAYTRSLTSIAPSVMLSRLMFRLLNRRTADYEDRAQAPSLAAPPFPHK
jgi:hypothetical protein